MMNSAIYQGSLRHRRFLPKHHEFSYRSTLFYLDLDELPQLFERTRFWSYNGRTPGSFRRSDYLGDPHRDLAEQVRATVSSQLGYCPSGPVHLLTNLRLWGWCFNPVSFYYCFEPDAPVPAVVLAQVNNTPWGECHCYALPCDAQGRVSTCFPKAMHVSPFNPMAMAYRWVSDAPAQRLRIHMENRAGQDKHTDATLVMERQPWDARALDLIVLRQPWLALKVSVAIYWQALRLFFKGVPVYGHTPIAGRDGNKSKLSKGESNDPVNPQ